MFSSVLNDTTAATEFSFTASTTTSSTVTTTTTTTAISDFTMTSKPLVSAGINNDDLSDGASMPSTSIVNAIVTPLMTYGQFDGLLNKWNLALEDQEKQFLHQVNQVNAWDRTLMDNGEKIALLHGEVEKVKQDQKRLENELDFVLSQQKELEEILIPLEESVNQQSGAASQQSTDEEHERTYQSAETIDAQLKQMTQDLKDVIEYLNSFAGPANTTDPLQQICKILNTHMNSLQWIDKNSGILQRKVEEVTQIMENHQFMEQKRRARMSFD
ncbi:nucleoporin-62 C-terminal-like protein [Erinaceus europaeus]|uniref:Nucleoporin-62 C-terminal-like protein n=1 Tax=Erinaceus europaeus TaxID=9365 RepID=A0A1S3WKT7_ERIEU|nr:nucleoporin-62 C-terminal-like protein [Erinaceus europaeus]